MNKQGEKTLGLFFGSYDRKRHLAFYVPYKSPPRELFCGEYAGHLTPTGEDYDLCEKCFELAHRINRRELND